jgi:hypothetical protein
MQEQAGWSQEARCALHPEYVAGSTCGRCGSFMCGQCSEQGAQSLCPSCRERLGVDTDFPLWRDTWSFSALWDMCWGIFQREWLQLCAASLVVFGVGFGVQMVVSVLAVAAQALGDMAAYLAVSLIGGVVQSAVQGVVTLGLIRLLFDVLAGRRMDLGVLFTQFHKAGRYLLGLLIIFAVSMAVAVVTLVGLGLVVAIVALAAVGLSGGELPDMSDPVAILGASTGALVGLFVMGVVLLVPLLYFTLPLVFWQHELAFNDRATAMDALRAGYTLARGQRLSMVGVLLVSVLLLVGGLLACCVGLIPAMAFSQLLLAGLYRALRKGSELEPA